MLVVLLLALALVAQWFSVKTRSGQLSASLVALVLAMSLLGPASAGGVRRRRDDPHIVGEAALCVALWLNNLATFAVVPFAEALWFARSPGTSTTRATSTWTQSVTFGLIVFGVFMVTVVLNFAHGRAGRAPR